MPHEAIERANRELARLRHEIDLFKGSMKRAEESIEKAEKLVYDIVMRLTLDNRQPHDNLLNRRPVPDSTGAKPPSVIRSDLEQAPDFI